MPPLPVMPPALEPGDRIAVVRPGNGGGGPEYPERYALGLRRLREVFGLKPVELPTCAMTREELTANPEARARDVVTAFEDPDLRGVFAVTGGSGEEVRILPHLDDEALRRHPTRFYGLSDNTSLGLHLWNLGVASWYGLQLMTQVAMNVRMHPYTVEHLRRAFFDDALGEVRPSERFTDQSLDWNDPATLHRELEHEVNPGWMWTNAREQVVEGVVWGGCLDVLEIAMLVDVPFPAPTDVEGGVLVLETSEEMPSAATVARVLMGLGERGLLERFDAVLVGRARARNHLQDPGPAARAAYRSAQRAAIEAEVARYAPDAVVVFDLDLGHTDPVHPVPLGGIARVDAGARTVGFP